MKPMIGIALFICLAIILAGFSSVFALKGVYWLAIFDGIVAVFCVFMVYICAMEDIP